MLEYKVADYRPAGIPVRRPEMGQAVVPVGTRAAVGFSSLLATALGAGTAWIGLRSGQRERQTSFKVMGYAVAAFGALVALSGVGGMFGTVFSPTILSGKTPRV